MVNLEGNLKIKDQYRNTLNSKYTCAVYRMNNQLASVITNQ